MNISPAQMDALRAACNAIVPSLKKPNDPTDYWQRRATDLQVEDVLVTTIAALREDEQRDFLRLVKLLNSPLLGLTWMGPFKKITDLSLENREKLMARWASSPVNDLRKSFQTIKKLTTFIYYSTRNGKANPNWEAIEYPGPITEPKRDKPAPIQVEKINADIELSCETLVIGSGAGGGVVAGELAAAGQDVIIVEKGDYYDETRITQNEADMIYALYDSRGALTTTDGGITVFAGSCLGGGTTVNWTGAFRTPGTVLESWASYGNPHFTSKAYQQCFAAVESMTHVDTNESPHNAQNNALWNGAKTLGYHVELIPRNVKGCAADGGKSCGYCGFGCQKGNKQGVMKTYLQNAFNHGARFLVKTEIRKILMENGKATSAEAVHTAEDGRQYHLKLRAKRVVLSAGAMHSPAVLMRSGIHHDHIGRHLYFHPTMAVSAIYKEKMNPWWGTMMSAVSNEFAHLDGSYGFKLETPPTHTGVLASALPWLSGEQHKALMLKASQLGSFIILTRDRDGGRVKVDKNGKMMLQYQISKYDLQHALRGLAEACRIHIAAGAQELFIPHNTLPYFKANNGSLETFLQDIPNWGWKPNQYALFSAHQMGTCRMGSNAKTHPVSPDGSLHQVKNLYVADASVFPESSGANPMLSIQAIAHYIAQGIK